MRLEEVGRSAFQSLKKLQEGHPNVLDYMIDGNLQLVINTPSGKDRYRTDEGRIRTDGRLAQHPLHHHAPRPPEAAVGAMEALRNEEMTVQAVQDRFPTHGRTRVAAQP